MKRIFEIKDKYCPMEKKGSCFYIDAATVEVRMEMACVYFAGYKDNPSTTKYKAKEKGSTRKIFCQHPGWG